MNTYEDKLVYDGWLKVYKRSYNNKEYDMIKTNNGVAAIIFNQKNQLLLVKQFRPAVLKCTLEIPAGCMDIENETQVECIAREVKEETGFDIPLEKFNYIMKFNSSVGFNDGCLYLFSAKVEFSDINEISDDDVFEMLWVDLSDVNSLIEQGQICDTKTILSYYYLMNKLKQ